MSRLFITVVGIVVAVLIAKMFLNDLEKEIAAHDCSMSDDEHDNR